MTEEEFRAKYPGLALQQTAWRLSHPLIPDEKYERLLELDAKELEGHDYYGDEEEAYEILGEYYPNEVE